MGRTKRSAAGRLTPAQQEELDRLRIVCARLDHQTKQGTIHHKHLVALEALAAKTPETGVKETKDNDATT